MSTSSFYHAESTLVTRDTLPATAPEPTATWNPISHKIFDGLVSDTLHTAGFQMRRTQYGLSKDGHRLFGVADLYAHVLDNEVGLSVGFRNSTDKRFAAGLCVGTRVFVCDNLCFSAEIMVMRKHCSRILEELPALLTDAVARIPEVQDTQREKVEIMKNRAVSDQMADHIIMEAASAGVVPASSALKVRNEWLKPSFEDFAPRTAWSLHNAFTEIFKQQTRHRNTRQADPSVIPENSLKLSRLFDTVYS